MKIGLLFNEAAGGNTRFPEIGRILADRLAGNLLLTCEGGLGGDFLRSTKTLSLPALDYIGRIGAAVESLAAAGIELLVCVGGDGFAAQCSEVLIRNSIDLVMLGVAGGTANVGPLLGFGQEDLAGLDVERCVERRVIALECSCGGLILGHAFNDVVIGDTFLGSLGGRMANLSLERFLATGEKVEKRPSRIIAGPDFRVMKNGIIKHSGLRAKQMIVAAPLNSLDFYRGKAVLGALCLAPWIGRNAVLAISDRSWIDTEADADGESFSPIEHLLFGTGDYVTMDGLLPSGQIVIDGNPFHRESEAVTLRSCLDAARVLFPSEGKT
jgi:hypothetical protein